MKCCDTGNGNYIDVNVNVPNNSKMGEVQWKRQMNSKPNLDRKWFWEFVYDKIDWQASYKTVIASIIERGDETEWTELIRFYGRDKVINALKSEIPYLHDYAIDDVSKYFSIPKEQILSHIRKQSRPGYQPFL